MDDPLYDASAWRGLGLGKRVIIGDQGKVRREKGQRQAARKEPNEIALRADSAARGSSPTFNVLQRQRGARRVVRVRRFARCSYLVRTNHSGLRKNELTVEYLAGRANRALV